MTRFIFSLVLFCVLIPSDIYAQKVRTSYPGTAGVNVPFWLTHETGLFKKYGLDHEALLISGSVTTMQALLAREIQFVNSSGAAAINARMQGADVTIVASYYDFMPYGLVVSKDIKTMEDLKGKRMAVASLGGINEAAIRFAFERQRMNSKDVTFIQAGGDPSRIAAVVSGAAAGTVLAPPGLFVATKQGLHMLADLGELGSKYPTSVIATKRSSLTPDRPTLKRYLMALIEGLHVYKRDRKLAIDVLQKYAKIRDQDLLVRSHDYLVKYTSLVPLADPSVLKIAVPPGKGTDTPVSDLYDNSIVQELVKEGFVDKVAKAAP
jgi:NitT/TauT family transport system substrate-binding protein